MQPPQTRGLGSKRVVRESCPRVHEITLNLPQGSVRRHPEMANHNGGRLTPEKSDSGELRCWPLPHSSPNSFHRFVTCAFVFSSMRISSGHGRVKPSLGHLRVASTPIFEPKSGKREA